MGRFEWIGDDGRVHDVPFDQDALSYDDDVVENDVALANLGDVGESPVSMENDDSIDARMDRLESKLDRILGALDPPTFASTAPKRMFTDEDRATLEAIPFPPAAQGLELDEPAPQSDQERAAAITRSARVEAAIAEQEARQAMQTVDPAEAVAAGLGITTPRPAPEDVEDGHSFRDQPAAPDDPFLGQ